MRPANEKRLLTAEEFGKLSDDEKRRAYNKCSYCRRMITCDPLQMALATGVLCEEFKEEGLSLLPYENGVI